MVLGGFVIKRTGFGLCRGVSCFSMYHRFVTDSKKSIKHGFKKQEKNVGKNVEKTKQVYRRNTIDKSSYCKSLIILFIWLTAFSRCWQLLLCEKSILFKNSQTQGL